jgi:flagellar hook-associated protein 3 FlgL
MQVSSRMLAENIKLNLMRQTKQILQTERRLVTGKKINKPSDDPAGMNRVLDYRKSINKIEQYDLNINEAKTRIEYSETIFESISDLIKEAKNIAANTSEDRGNTLADNVAIIREEILQHANSKLGDNYLFGGFQTATLPFQSDGTYNGDTGEKSYLIADNIQVSLTADGSDIFQSAADIFTVLDDLETALLADDSVTIKAQVQPLADIESHLEEVRSENSAKFRRLDVTQNHWDSFKVSVQDMLRNTEEADVTAEALNMKVQQTSYEIALATSASIIQPNLMQFLR